MTPRPPRGEWTGHGRASRKAAEKAWEQEFAVAERRGVLRVRDRLLALHAEHHRVVDGIEYLEWSAIAAALDEEVSRPAPPRPPGGGAPGPTATPG